MKRTCLLVALVLSAYLMSVAISSPNLWWLGWGTLIPLFCAIRWLPSLASMLAGAVWGLSLFIFTSTTGLVAPSLGAGAFLTVVPALYTLCGSRMTRRIGFSPYLLALGWVGVELSLHPLGLKAGLLAATQGHGFALQVVGSFTGYVVVAFLVAYFNAVLFAVLSEARIAGSLGRRLPVTTCGPRSIVWIDIPSYLPYLIAQSHPRAPPV